MEILKGVFDEYEYNEELMTKIKKKEYHIYLEYYNGKSIVKIKDPFPVKYMPILRFLLKGIKYDDIIIGDPEL